MNIDIFTLAYILHFCICCCSKHLPLLNVCPLTNLQVVCKLATIALCCIVRLLQQTGNQTSIIVTVLKAKHCLKPHPET